MFGSGNTNTKVDQVFQCGGGEKKSKKKLFWVNWKYFLRLRQNVSFWLGIFNQFFCPFLFHFILTTFCKQKRFNMKTQKGSA